MRRNWRDRRFLVTAILALVLGICAGLTSGAGLDRDLEIADWAARAAVDRSDLERAIFVRSPSPWTFVREGGEHRLPDHLLLLPGFVDYPKRRIDEPKVSASRALDWSFVVVFLLSLGAIVSTFDVVSAERESGTLESVLAGGAGRGAVLGGIVTGSMASFLPLVTAAFAVNVVTVMTVADVGIETLDPGVLCGVLTLSWLLMTCMILVACLASVVARSSVNAGLLGLLAWAAMAVVVPGAAVLVAESLHPTPSLREVEVAVDSARKRFLSSTRSFSSMEIREIVDRSDLSDQEKRRRLGRLQEEITGQHLGRLGAYKTEVARLRESYLDSMAEQAALAKALSKMSPVGLFHSATEALVGTGLPHHYRFLRQAHQRMEDYTRIVDEERPAFEPRIYGPVIKESGVELHSVLWASWRGMGSEVIRGLELREAPVEVPMAPGAAMRDGLWLVIVSLGLGGLLFFAFR